MKSLIIGTGDMAHALAVQFERTAKDEARHSMKIASPSREFVPNTYFHDTDIAFVKLDDGIEEAEIIILAIPGKAMPSFLEQHADKMKDALIIDINNDPTAQETETYEKFDLHWVKGFNDCGAVDILTRKSKKNPRTRISGRSTEALKQARTFAQDVMGFDVQATAHDKRKATEQDTIGKEWKHSIYVAIVVFTFYFIMVVCTYWIRWPFPYNKHEFPVKTQNKVMSSTAITLFALSVIPGSIARIIKAWHQDSMYRLRPSIVWALGIRKHVGLLGLYFLGLHAVMSLVEFSPNSYYWCFYDSRDAKGMNLVGEISMFFAIISTSLFCIVGLASLPSVGESMNKAQWDLIFGPVVWLALACGQIHCVVIYFKVVQGTRVLYGGIPHVTMLAGIIPWFAFFLKFVQMIACRVLPLFKAAKGDKLNTTMHSGHKSKRNVFDNSVNSTLNSTHLTGNKAVTTSSKTAKDASSTTTTKPDSKEESDKSGGDQDDEECVVEC